MSAHSAFCNQDDSRPAAACGHAVARGNKNEGKSDKMVGDTCLKKVPNSIGKASDGSNSSAAADGFCPLSVRTVLHRVKKSSHPSALNSGLFLYAGLYFPLIPSPFAAMPHGASCTPPPRRAAVAAVHSAEYSSTLRKVLFRSPPCVHPFAATACRAWRSPYVGTARLPLPHRSRMSWFQIFVPSRCDAGRKHGFASPGSPDSFPNGKKQEKDE